MHLSPNQNIPFEARSKMEVKGKAKSSRLSTWRTWRSISANLERKIVAGCAATWGLGGVPHPIGHRVRLTALLNYQARVPSSSLDCCAASTLSVSFILSPCSTTLAKNALSAIVSSTCATWSTNRKLKLKTNSSLGRGSCRAVVQRRMFWNGLYSSLHCGQCPSIRLSTPAFQLPHRSTLNAI